MPCQSCGKLGTPEGENCRRCTRAGSFQASQEKGCKFLALALLGGTAVALASAALGAVAATHGL